MSSVEVKQLKVRCVSHFVGHRYKRAYFDCITTSHIVCNENIIQDKNTRVKIVYDLQDTPEAADLFSKTFFFDKEIIFQVDISTQVEKNVEGYIVNQYKASSAKCEQSPTAPQLTMNSN